MRQKSFSRNTSFLEQFKIMFQEVNLHLSWLDFCLTQPIYIPLTKFIPHLLFTFSMDCLLVTMLSTQFPITLLNGWFLGTLDLFFFDGSILPISLFFPYSYLFSHSSFNFSSSNFSSITLVSFNTSIISSSLSLNLYPRSSTITLTDSTIHFELKIYTLYARILEEYPKNIPFSLLDLNFPIFS